MMSQRLDELLRLLQCTNSDIARFAGYSPSNVSRLKSGMRQPKPESRTVLRLARGIYRYADYENVLHELCALCGTEDERESKLIPALVAWLYGETEYELPKGVTPKRKREQQSRLQSFSERLDQAMTLLDYTNSRLAADLNVDASLVSRYRTGIYYPNPHASVRERLPGLLLARATKMSLTDQLASLCGTEKAGIGVDAISEWLYEAEDQPYSEIAESIFRSIETFSPGPGLSASAREIPPIQTAERYWGTGGLRDAVVRFLTDAAREGGELLLYSDEPMNWMSADPEYFALWASLMVACIQKGVHIRIIHHVNRDGLEMVSAIRGWLPLYISGMIEPYIFSEIRNARFYHTIFLRPGKAGIVGFFPREAGERRWYDYITEKDRLDAMAAGYDAMLSCASPFLKTYPPDRIQAFWARYREHAGHVAAILRGLSVATIPDRLFDQMLARAEADEQQKNAAVSFYRTSREHLFKMLKNGELHELLCLPEWDEVLRGKIKVNLEAETNGLCLTYTPEEYRAHIRAVQELIGREKNYHLTLLPYAPFQDLQVFTLKDAVAVIRCKEPYTAFVFLNATLMQSVSFYCDSLTKQYASNRFNTIQTLEKNLAH